MSTLAAYARISDDQAGDAQGVERQIQDARALIERRGMTATVYIDNDLSAFKRHIVRPQFEQMLNDLRDGKVSGIVAYDLDRLWRQPMDLERVITIYEQRQGLVFATLQADIDLSTSDGRMLARVMVAAANKSSDDTARRVKRKHADNQQKGLPAGGPRPFGFQPDRITHDPREAEAVREMCEQLLAGKTMAEVVRTLNDAGIVSTLGNPWKPGSLRAVLRNPRLKGMRARFVKPPRGSGWWEQVTDAAGQPVEAVWAPILTPEQFDALQAHLDAKTALYKGGSHGGLVYLLTGLARCGICGGLLRGTKSLSRGNYSYTCQPPVMGGCGGVARSGQRIDEIVTEAAMSALGAILRGSSPVPVSVDASPRLSALDALLADSLTAWKAGTLPSADYFTLRADLTAERKTIEAEQGEAFTREKLQRIAVDAPSHWESASLAQRRALLSAMFAAVVVDPLPVVNGRKVVKWNPALIRIIPNDAHA